jgi:uncharacterized protein YdaU (DUF1376 family)
MIDMPDDLREYFRQQGKIGAKKRVKVLTPEQRTKIARDAANARWSAKRTDEQRHSKKSLKKSKREV